MDLTDPANILLYTSFVIHVTCLVSIAIVYRFAYRFLSDRFYKIIGLGWLTNAIYVAFETYLLIASNSYRSILYYLIVFVALTSTLIFHFAVYSDKKITNNIKYIKKFHPIYGLITISLFITGMIFVDTTNDYNYKFWFSLLILPTVIYSFIVLILISYRFFVVFPDSEYGLRSKILYSSWGIYGVIQFFYPLMIYKEIPSIEYFAHSVFALAFCLKIINVVALLNILQKEFAILQTEIHESSVLKDLGDIAAGLHHDIAHPLGLIDGELTYLRQNKKDDTIVKNFLENINKPMKMISAAISLVNLVRLDPEIVSQGFKRTSVKVPVPLARSFYKKRFETSDLRIIYKENKVPSLYIRANENLLAEAFLNIMKNASEASASNLEIQIRRAERKSNSLEFLFFNNGERVSEEELENCFKAGWSSKEKREKRIEKGNVGMGLYMCSRIARFHNGTIELYNIDEFLKKSLMSSNKELLSKYNVVVNVTIPISRSN